MLDVECWTFSSSYQQQCLNQPLPLLPTIGSKSDIQNQLPTSDPKHSSPKLGEVATLLFAFKQKTNDGLDGGVSMPFPHLNSSCHFRIYEFTHFRI